MNIKELMVDNYINVCDEYPREVLKIDLNNMCDIESSTDNDMFEPILLDKEWFLKCGFKKIDHIAGYTFYSLSRSKTNPCHIAIFETYTKVNTMWSAHIKYLHDLQNLYFALTKHELIIDL